MLRKLNKSQLNKWLVPILNSKFWEGKKLSLNSIISVLSIQQTFF